MPRMTRLPSDLNRWGLKVRVVDGAGSRGKSEFAPAIVRDHWTGTTQRAGLNMPTLNVLINGHGSLPGPLCQVAHGRDGSATVVAMGRANDGGRGLWKGVTGNSGGYGIESEANGPRNFTAAQRFTYPIIAAAMLHGLGRDASYTASHAEFALPKGRKTDINGWPDGEMPGFRRRVKALLDAGPDASPLHHYPDVESAIAALGPDPTPVTTTTAKDWFDMATKEDLEAVVNAALASHVGPVKGGVDWLVEGVKSLGGKSDKLLTQTRHTDNRLAVAVREATGKRVTPEQVRAIVGDVPDATVRALVALLVGALNEAVTEVEDDAEAGRA